MNIKHLSCTTLINLHACTCNRFVFSYNPDGKNTKTKKEEQQKTQQQAQARENKEEKKKFNERYLNIIDYGKEIKDKKSDGITLITI